MTTTRKGIDRITKQELHAQIADLTTAITRHVDNCPRCKQARKEIRMHCPDWWILAIARHKIQRKHRQYTEPEMVADQMLPGMENLDD